jgi:hypothetical protein
MNILSLNLSVLNFVFIGVWERKRSQLEKLDLMPGCIKYLFLEIFLHFNLNCRSLGEEIIRRESSGSIRNNIENDSVKNFFFKSSITSVDLENGFRVSSVLK